MRPMTTLALLAVPMHALASSALSAPLEPQPFAVAPKLPDAANLLSPSRIRLDGWLGARVRANATERLLNVDVEPLLQALVERGERRARNIGASTGARDGQAIAARDDGDAELTFDAIEMLIALAEELRQQGVVVELHLHAARLARRRRPAHAASSATASSPARLLGPTAKMRTGAISPASRGGAAACTA